MGILTAPFSPRFITLTVCLVTTALLGWLLFEYPGMITDKYVLPIITLVTGFLSLVGIRDLIQSKSAILRNYPIAGHIRFLFEEIRPEIRQYLIEGETDGAPFSRHKRSIVYQRAKGALDKRPFGTELDVYDTSFEWLNHSIAAKEPARDPFRVTIGGPDCTRPYSASLFNISAMSFGALSANAILALNRGAKMGNFAHDTGEGGFSRYHKQPGGDIIWEIGSGYFGCRNKDGTFSAERFAETARADQIKMIEIKLSQGAKPGHGGVLPGAKVSAEIAEARGVKQGEDCVSPSRHSAFATPVEMMQFIAQLRYLSGGKPVGFKLCIGHPWEFLAIGKAMLETGITPDFIVVDGKEGGTGAAPVEFTDHVGMPLREGLTFVHQSLTGMGLRDRIKIGASGKIISAFDIARALALGADWCNSARGFMFAVGCIQSQSCHTDKCPVGVATQSKSRQRALDVPDKASRVAMFHGSTIKALSEVVAAAGLEHPNQLRPHHFSKRISASQVVSFDALYPPLAPAELLAGTNHPRFRDAWAMAQSHSFEAAMPAPMPVFRTGMAAE